VTAAHALDVIVLAGDRRASKAVLGENKAFLPLAGAPVLHHVVAAIEQARCTDRIFVVGDAARIERSLGDPASPVRGVRPIVAVPQGDTLYDNVWAALRTALGNDAPPSPASEELTPAARAKVVLLVTGDAPLLVREEIDELVDAADLGRFDYCLGVTAETTLAAYYPRDGRPGIAMTYWDLHELSWRQANLHLFRPFAVGNRGQVERGYELRYQRDWLNIAKAVAWLWRMHHLSHRTVTAFLSLQLARLARRIGVLRAPVFRPFLLTRRRFETATSALAGTRFTIVETHYGGGALDVDDADAYEAIRANFDAWRAHQAAIARARAA
jgi:CTP:molybdopterin cytidylyltransferase MocA